MLKKCPQMFAKHQPGTSAQKMARARLQTIMKTQQKSPVRTGSYMSLVATLKHNPKKTRRLAGFFYLIFASL
jgi:hypothetical protein